MFFLLFNPFRKFSKIFFLIFSSYYLFVYLVVSVHNHPAIIRDCLKCDNQNEPFSFFWKIKRSKPSPPSYFFGTIHAPYTKVWNYVPSQAKSAFRHSDRIIFELDLMNADTLLSLIRCQLLPPGIKLSDVIPIDIYRRLQRHLKYIKYKMPLWITEEQKSRGLYADHLFDAITMHWERKRPIWVMIMLNSLTENDIKSKGIAVLDSFFYQKAKKLKKFIGSVENAEEQCITLNYLNTTQVIYALNQTLFQHESIRWGIRRSNHTTDDMIRHYNCGNLNEALFSEDSTNIPMLKNHTSGLMIVDPQAMDIAKNIENYFRLEILLKRNKRMSKRVRELLDSNRNESFFFVFGAGHFLGNDSIIELMERDGIGGHVEIVHINNTHSKNSLMCDGKTTTVGSPNRNNGQRRLFTGRGGNHRGLPPVYPVSTDDDMDDDISPYYRNSFVNPSSPWNLWPPSGGVAHFEPRSPWPNTQYYYWNRRPVLQQPFHSGGSQYYSGGGKHYHESTVSSSYSQKNDLLSSSGSVQNLTGGTGNGLLFFVGRRDRADQQAGKRIAALYHRHQEQHRWRHHDDYHYPRIIGTLSSWSESMEYRPLLLLMSMILVIPVVW